MKVVIQLEGKAEELRFLARRKEIEKIINLCLKHDITAEEIEKFIQRRYDFEGIDELELEGLVEIEGGDDSSYGGIVIDPIVAEATPCTCFEIGDGEICFSKGIIGALSKEQKDIYCKRGKAYKSSEKLKERLEKFKEVARTCRERTQFVKKGRILAFLECMSDLLAEK